jgi:uncharacterized membrane protein YtjA (UPF0391 family)
MRRSLTAFSDERGTFVIKWAIIFFIISVVAGFFGFTEVAKDAKGIAKILFYIALAIFLIVLVFGVFLGMLVF